MCLSTTYAEKHFENEINIDLDHETMNSAFFDTVRILEFGI